jgi:hypothetical protein
MNTKYAVVILLNISLILLMISCTNSQDMHWKEIETKGTEKNNNKYNIGTNYFFNKFLFINEKIGFFTGRYDNEIDNENGEYKAINISKNQDAIILRTTDSGFNWKETILGKGEISDFNTTNNVLIVLQNSYHGEEADEVHSHIHISNDQGESWQKMSTNQNDRIDQIHFWSSSKGIGICGIHGYRYPNLKILLTDDTGGKWEEIKLPKIYSGTDFNVSSKGMLYYLTKECDSYIEVNLNTLESKEIVISNTKELPFSMGMDNNDNLYFVAEDQSKRNIIYRKLDDKNFQRIEFPFKDTMVNDVYIFDNIISIIVDENDGLYYRSEDNGKSWSEEKISNPFINRVAFYGKDNVWIRTVPGKMLIR